jgi:hypothetical protein
MEHTTAFDRFASTILHVYRRDKEAFWAAVMAPFLSNNVSFLAWLGHIRIDLELLAAFRGLDTQAQQILNDFGTPLGLDIVKWKSNRHNTSRMPIPYSHFWRSGWTRKG